MDAILKAMLARVPDSYDKTEGSIFHDTLAPVAPELEALALKADEILTKRFLDTATGSDLDRAAAEFGVTRKAAQYASGSVTLTGTVGKQIPAGALVASEAAQYYTREDCIIGSDGSVDVGIVCTEPGLIGNVGAGYVTRFPVTIAGVTAVTNAAGITGGYSAETDDELRERTYQKIRAPGTSGNRNDYVTWAMSVEGVGGAKVTPLWNGNGTVKVVIVDSNGETADDTLVADVKAYIETVRPVGADVTVASASALKIDVAATVVFTVGYNAAAVSDEIVTVLTKYLRSFRLSGVAVSYARIGALILGVTGVDDYSDLTVNGGTDNISIDDDSVPVMGGFTYA